MRIWPSILHDVLNAGAAVHGSLFDICKITRGIFCSVFFLAFLIQMNWHNYFRLLFGWGIVRCSFVYTISTKPSLQIAN